MSNHIADTNKMVSDTPRTTDRVVFIDGNPWVNAPFAVSLELELKAANERIKRLEKAGDELLMWLGEDISESNGQLLQDAWNKAKEDKP